MKRKMAVAATSLALVIAGPAAAHPGDHGEGQTAVPPAPAEPAAGDKGGTSPFVIGGVTLGLVGLAGGLVYVRERQRRAPGRAAAAGASPPREADAEARTRQVSRASW